MRIDVVKYLFVGPRSQWGPFFEQAQEAGKIQFIDPAGKGREELPESAQLLYNAHKVLKRYPIEEQAGSDTPAAQIAQQIIALKDQIDVGLEEERLIFQEIPRAEPFGDFSYEDRLWIEREAGLVLQFFMAKQGRATGVEADPELIFVNQAQGLDYFVSISKRPRQIPKLTEIRVDRPIGVLRARLEELAQERRLLEAQLRELTQFDRYLQEALLDQLDEHHLLSAMGASRPVLDEQLFVVSGWVPKNQIATLPLVFEKLKVYWHSISTEKGDRVPTYLYNPGLKRIGEDLIQIYDTPSISDKDPSLWVLGAFVFFFAMILGDGGYGLLLLTGASFALWKWRTILKAGMRRTLQLFVMLGAAATLWGLLFSSFFGISIGPDNPLRRVSVVDWATNRAAAYHLGHETRAFKEWLAQHPQLEGVTSPEALIQFQETTPDGRTQTVIADMLGNEFLLELSLVVGVIHLVLSMLRNLRRQWAGAGWILFILGAYLYFPTYLKTTSMIHYIFHIDPDWGGRFGFQLLFVGIGFACLLALLQHRWRGLEEPVKVIQIFADIFSYLRLYALGLAGAMMAQTFNRMAGDVGLVFGLLVLLAGHSVNLVMSLGSCFIHGLRLNFIEWYHYSFEGGGRPFRPLKLLRKERT
jgi:V/A-type H+/Na+-transporting ATPase subunit I